MKAVAMKSFALLAVFVLASAPVIGGVLADLRPGMELPMHDNWRIQSARHCRENGETISLPGYNCQGWYSASVPCTVMGALMQNNQFPDLFLGKNMEKIPAELFQTSWWYRLEFVAPGNMTFANARLIFEGINYRADIWLNGKRIAASDDIFGSFRIFDIDISHSILKNRNFLAVEVFPPKPGDFTIGFVDWNPRPADNNMGLWRGVKLRLSGPVSLNHLFVQSRLDLKTYGYADLAVRAELINHSQNPIKGMLKGEIEKIRFSRPFVLKPFEHQEALFSPDRFPQLHVRNPRLWWPHTLGKPELYDLVMTVEITSDSGPAPDEGLAISDRQAIHFGIRDVAEYINSQGHRGYMVNGREVLIRGGGWVDDLFLVEDARKLEAQIRYCRQMNLNAIRLEGFWGSSQKLYDLADRYGILLMAGWSCQWEWQNYLGRKVDEEFGGIQTKEDMELVSRYWRDQVLWLRHHPSIFVWVLQSDLLPRPEMEREYFKILKEIDPTRPVLASCKSHVSEVSGPTAVKMAGPYDYVTPNYWYEDTKNGGAFGFNTETGPGPQPPVAESIRRMIPADSLWPINEFWDYHCARNEFNKLDRYLLAFNKRYGMAASMEEFAFKAQAANYEAIRPMFEAFRINRPVSTGIIQWMYNSAWPKMYWQLYDYFLLPTGAFYGTRKACRPLHLAFHYGNRGIYALNDTLAAANDLKAVIKLLAVDSRPISSWNAEVSIPANGSAEVMELPPFSQRDTVYFLSLKLRDKSGKEVADSFYWLSGKEDILDTANTTWFCTPNLEFADFRALSNLPAVRIEASHRFETVGSQQKLTVTLRNPGDKIAFFIELRVAGERSGRTVAPVFWDDNYVSLLPGETKILQAHFFREDLHDEQPLFHYSGWNVTGGNGQK